jgi:hypothetical protein
VLVFSYVINFFSSLAGLWLSKAFENYEKVEQAQAGQLSNTTDFFYLSLKFAAFA